jgi:hypothetical protein
MSRTKDHYDRMAEFLLHGDDPAVEVPFTLLLRFYGEPVPRRMEAITLKEIAEMDFWVWAEVGAPDESPLSDRWNNWARQTSKKRDRAGTREARRYQKAKREASNILNSDAFEAAMLHQIGLTLMREARRLPTSD